jgi:chromosome segregation ATPase
VSGLRRWYCPGQYAGMSLGSDPESDLDSAAAELYGLAPEDFTARRTALAAEARQAGEANLAREITGLRRPAVAAWLINQLVRMDPAELDELSSLGQELRQAHVMLDGGRLRELSADRQRMIRQLTARLEQHAAEAGRVVNDEVSRQLHATFEAAIADADAERAVRSGRLTKALSYSGFGEVDLTNAVATRPRPRLLRAVESLPDETTAEQHRPAEQQRPAEQHRHDAVTSAIAEAERNNEELRRSAQQLASQLEQARQQRAAAGQRVDDLTAQLSAARGEMRDAESRLREAQRSFDTALSKQQRAERLLAAAKARRAD